MKTTYEIFSENLRNQLMAHNRSQAELAKFLGVSQVIVSKWVNGTSMPRNEKLDNICIFLGCDREDLFTDHNKPVELAPEDIIAEQIRENPRLMRLMLHAMKLSDNELDKLIEQVRK